jgi:hypothetical protein
MASCTLALRPVLYRSLLLLGFVSIGLAWTLAHAASQSSAKPDTTASPEMDICSTNAAADRTRPYVNEAKAVYFVNVRDGDKVTSPFRIAFGLVGMGIAPAGVNIENTGHHHLLIDQKLSNDMLTRTIPFTEKYRHYGKGQSEAVLELPVGKHTLRLLFADANHKPYYVSSKEITIEVVARNGLAKQ